MREREGLLLVLDIVDSARTCRDRGLAWSRDLARVHEYLRADLAMIEDRLTIQVGSRSILFVPVDDAFNLRHPSGRVFLTLLSTIHLQAELCTVGIFFRGIVAFGRVVVGPGFIAGAGIDYALMRHSQLPQYPRVVIDPQLFYAIGHDVRLRRIEHGRDEEYAYIQQVTGGDSDGFLFIDYISAIADETDSHDEYIEWLDVHRAQVQAKYDTLSDSSRWFAAWHWLGSQHNQVVGDLSVDEPGSDRAIRNLKVMARIRPRS